MELLTFIGLFTIVNGFLLDDKLPQYNRYGRSLVLVGGNLYDNNTEIYQAIVRFAGGVHNAKLGIVTAAASDPGAICSFYSSIFLHQYHVRSTYCIPIDVNRTSANKDQHVIDKIKQQTGFFFGGGEPQRIIDSLYLNQHVPSPALLAIKDKFNEGAVISGTSAGIECLPSAVTIRAGKSWNSLKYGVHETEDESHPDNLLYNKYGGLGFLDGFFLDAHFSQRGREGRLIRLLSDTRRSKHGVDWGIGIDENTALVVSHVGTHQSKAEVIGQNGAVVVDITKSYVNTSKQYFNIDNVKVHYITHGDTLYLWNKTIKFSSSKLPMSGSERHDHALTSNDIFGGSTLHPSQKPEFPRVATSIFDSRLDNSSHGDTIENNPMFRVYMSREAGGAEGYSKRKRSFDTDITSYKNLYVKIFEQTDN